MNSLNNLLTVKSQLKLLLTVLDDWLIPSKDFLDTERALMFDSSELLKVVYEQLELRAEEIIKNGG